MPYREEQKRRSLLALVLFASTIGIASKVVTEFRGAPSSPCVMNEGDLAKARPLETPEPVRPASTAGAELVPQPETPLPFSLDSVIKVVEQDAVLMFGSDMETRVARTLRVDATGATIDSAIDLTDVADIVSCGGSRWLLKLTAIGDLPKYTIGVAGAPAVWSHIMPTDVTARCMAGHLMVSRMQDGVLVTQVLSPAVEAEHQVRVAPSGDGVEVSWVAATTSELYVLVHRSGPENPGATELLSVAADVITHRHALPNALTTAIAMGSDSVLVGTAGFDKPAEMQSFTRIDLKPGPVATVSGTSELVGIWPGPNDVVAVAMMGSAGPARPCRRNSPCHTPYSWTLRRWDAAKGATGPPVDLGEASGATVAWIKSSVVVLQPAAVEHNRLVQPTRLRRFIAAR